MMPAPRKVEKICIGCGKSYTVVASNAAESHYCSKKCQMPGINSDPARTAKASQSRRISPKTGHKVEFICDNCGNPFHEYLSKRPNALKFCTRECGLIYQGKKQQTADIEPVTHLKPDEPSMTVVYDPIKRQLRNDRRLTHLL